MTDPSEPARPVTSAAGSSAPGARPGPRRPPRPAGPAGPAAPGSDGSGSRGPRRPPRPAERGAQPAGPRGPTPAAPGPRPDKPERVRPALPRPAVSGARFRRMGSTRTADADADADDLPTPEPIPKPEDLLPAAPAPRTAFRRRYGVVYDTQGPRVRLGVLWAIAVTVSLAAEPLRPYGLAILYAVVAGVAAMQVVDAWHSVRSGADRWVAALGASALPVLATAGVRPLGAGLLLTVVLAIAAAGLNPKRDLPVFASAGHTVFAAGACGGAAAAIVLLADYEIGAVIILLVYLMVYDASDYIVGSGATNGIEGPLAGGLLIVAVTALLAATEVPPFHGPDIWSFAALAVLACPGGQLLASVMLPSAAARAPALRRLDSALIVAPAWAGLIGLYLQRVGA